MEPNLLLFESWRRVEHFAAVAVAARFQPCVGVVHHVDINGFLSGCAQDVLLASQRALNC